jgi:putative transposase
MDIFDLIKQGKVKRYFRSRNKISYPGAVSHITQRAPGKEKLFIEEGDYLRMLYLIKTAVKKFNLRLFSFVLMPNHIHYLFQLNKDNLSSSLKYIFNNYAFYFNRKYERKGHVFSGRFRQALCFDESYLLASSVYIHSNPVVARLTSNFTEYRWSSVIPFVQKFVKKTSVDYRFILRLLDVDIKIARYMYRQLLRNSIKIKVGNLWDNPQVPEFFRDKFMTKLKEILHPKNRLKSLLSIDSEIEKINRQKNKKDPQTIAAKVYLIEQLKAKGYKMTEIAQKLGLSRQALYHILKHK